MDEVDMFERDVTLRWLWWWEESWDDWRREEERRETWLEEQEGEGR